ncbi:MAG: beta-galactosidase, partial [Clostridiales bacterium]|nr:beta-galactosidase [Clostridiales bacterium]
MKRFHENPNTLHVGTLENRSYYIPFSNKKAAMAAVKEASDRYVDLNGEWNFAYFDSFEQVPETITFENTIPVPSAWQYHGYDKHQYTNTRYPIPYDPPYVPHANPCGVYERNFTIEQTQDLVYTLNFEGVDSCYYVWVNGTFVGFSQVSHSTSEFDISPFIHMGENTLRVMV